MKKLLLFALLSLSLFGDAKIYMGTGYSLYSESYTNSAMDNIATTDHALKLKIGYGIRESYAVEFSLDYIDHASYSETDSQSKLLGKAKYGFDIALIKAFELGIYVNPYLKVGFGTGILDNKGKDEKSLTYGSFDFGTGIYIPINSSYDIELGYEYKHLSYQKLNELDGTEKNESNVNVIYLGVNARF